MTTAKNGKPPKDRLDRIEELLNMAAAQTAENAVQLRQMRAEFNREMKQTRAEHRSSRAEHDRDMKEIRVLFKDMIRRIAY